VTVPIPVIPVEVAQAELLLPSGLGDPGESQSANAIQDDAKKIDRFPHRALAFAEIGHDSRRLLHVRIIDI